MKNVVIVGVGALGSHLVQFIRNCDVKITVVDYDRVEQKNTMSQFHVRNSVGKNKTQSLSQLMQMFFNLKLQSIPHKLTADNVYQLLGNSDLIIDCLDNGEARRLVQGYAREKKVACLHGALAADGGFGRVVWDDFFVIDEADGEGAATCEDGQHLPFIGLTAAALARATQIFLEKGDRVGYQIHPGGIDRV